VIKRSLITTAEEITWKTDVPILFLGEWCRLYDRKAVWEKLDAEVVPYHWDDRDKLYKDYGYLRKLYERVLNEVATRLNETHRVKHSQRYWRILIGPWLGDFIPIVFDRWEMIQRAVKHYDISEARVIEGDLAKLVPNNMDDFEHLFIGDQWNQAIYGYLLEHWTDVHCERIKSQSPLSANINVSNSQISIKQRIRRFLASIASKASAFCVRPDEALFIADCLPLRESVSLQWQLGQIPRLWRMIAPPSVAVNSESRCWHLGDIGDNDFERALRALIPLQIPALYLEGYDRLMEQVSALPWPQRPRFIFTSNAYCSDDVFKAWTAEKVEADAPLVIGQHGGGCTCLWSFPEEHEMAISDRFLSWGWEDIHEQQDTHTGALQSSTKVDNKIKPVGNLKMVGRRLSWDPGGCALMVEMSMPRYSYYMYSVPVASQWLGYFEEQSRFVNALSPKLREQLLVRLYNQDFGWYQKKRWQDRFPQISVDDGVVPLPLLIEKSRLCISAYKGTTFMETLAMDIPTLMFWDPKSWELCASARPYFEQMKEVGIFHETPESAAAKMTEIWDDVPGWWHQPEIQEVRRYFCDRFSRMPENPLRILKDALTTVKPGGSK